MTYFNPRKKSELLVDGSPILNQDGKIVSYASRALSDVESRYSQTEREMLSAVWGAEHFHLYLNGSEFTILTNHQPLLGIFKHQRPTSARIERWRIRLTPYQFTIEYRPGRDENNPADYISRHPNVHTEHSDPVEDQVNYICRNTVPKTMSIEQVREATAADSTLHAVIATMITNKWSKPDVVAFRKIHRELSVHDGLVHRGTKLVLPTSLQQTDVDLAHTGHRAQ